MNRWQKVIISTLVVFSTLLVTLVATAFLPRQEPNGDAEYRSYLPTIFSRVPGPTILYFQADVTIADPGDTIQLEWASVGATGGDLVRIAPGGPIVQWWAVAPTGTFDYTISPSERNFVSFGLTVSDDDGLLDSRYLSIPLTCPDTWFFSPAPDSCPRDAPLYSIGAEQPFEDGFMLWVEAEEYIYVLFDDDIFSPRWMIYPDTWQEGEPLCDAGPIPPGYFQPQRGFGKVWCEQADVRDRLGWATELETGYDTAVQQDSAPKYSTRYVRAADGNVWKLLPERSGWEKIIVTNAPTGP